MNIIYETTKERGATILMPTSMVDAMNPGAAAFALNMAKNDPDGPKPGAGTRACSAGSFRRFRGAGPIEPAPKNMASSAKFALDLDAGRGRTLPAWRARKQGHGYRGIGSDGPHQRVSNAREPASHGQEALMSESTKIFLRWKSHASDPRCIALASGFWPPLPCRGPVNIVGCSQCAVPWQDQYLRRLKRLMSRPLEICFPPPPPQRWRSYR